MYLVLVAWAEPTPKESDPVPSESSHVLLSGSLPSSEPTPKESVPGLSEPNPPINSHSFSHDAYSVSSSSLSSSTDESEIVPAKEKVSVLTVVVRIA